MVTKRPENRPENGPREVSAREALLKPLKLVSKSRLQEIAKKLQKIGKARGPNDPDLT